MSDKPTKEPRLSVIHRANQRKRDARYKAAIAALDALGLQAHAAAITAGQSKNDVDVALVSAKGALLTLRYRREAEAGNVAEVRQALDKLGSLWALV